MEEEHGGTLLRRMLHKAALAVTSVAHLRPSPRAPVAAAATPSPRTPGLLDCMASVDVDDGASSTTPSFHTPRSSSNSAATTPAGEVVHSSRRLAGMMMNCSPSLAGGVDVDRRAAEFIERFRRNASLELRYCSPVTPMKPPASPDTYFNLSRMHGAGSPAAAAAYGRWGSPRTRPSGGSIKWPTAGPYFRRRPTVRV